LQVYYPVCQLKFLKISQYQYLMNKYGIVLSTVFIYGTSGFHCRRPNDVKLTVESSKHLRDPAYTTSVFGTLKRHFSSRVLMQTAR